MRQRAAVKPCGMPRVKDRRVLNGIFLGLAIRRIVAGSAGSLQPSTACYNWFVRWRRGQAS